MVCSVDLETGITKENAENYLGMRFSNHPVTGVALEGFEIPKWHEVLECVSKMPEVQFRRLCLHFGVDFP